MGERPEAERILAAYVDRLGPEEAIDAAELCAQHPELADELRDMVEDWRELLGMMRRPEQAAAESALVQQLRERRALPDGRYERRGEVAHGGMGAILEVWDRDLSRSAAMKVVREAPWPEGVTPAASERALGRFLDEARITGQLEHPGVVPVHELGLDGEGRVYFTMRLVDGVELGEVLRLARIGAEGWSQMRVLGVVVKVCEAVAYAHSKGVIHRDLKPANVMVGRFGEVYVMDWGLARVQDREDGRDLRPRSRDTVRTARAEADDSGADLALLTMDGDVVGTPAYMSPEQARGDLAAMGPASDVYSIGAILYHLLAGHMPFVPTGAHPGAPAVLGRVQAGAPAPLAEVARGAPSELVSICERAMAREVAQRYADVRELAADLSAYVEGRVVRAHRTGALVELSKWVRRNRALAASLLVALVAAVGGSAAVAWVSARAERAARGETYTSQVAAAWSSLERGDGADARLRLEACPEEHHGWEWRFLTQRADSSLGRFDGLPSEGLATSAIVQAVACDPTGTYVAAGSSPDGPFGANERTVRLWTADARELVHTFGDLRAVIHDVTFGPAGERLASTGWSPGGFWGDDQETCVWSLTDRALAAHCELGGSAIAFHPTRPNLLAIAARERLVLWDYETDERREQAVGSGQDLAAVRSLAFFDDGAWLVTGLSDGRVLLWDVQALWDDPDASPIGNWNLQHLVSKTPDLLWGGVTDLDVAVGGERILAALGSGDAVLLAPDNARPLVAVLSGHARELSGARFLPDGSALTSSLDGTLRRWDAETATNLQVWHGHRDQVRAVDVGPGGRVVSGSRDGTVRAWSEVEPTNVTTLQGEAIRDIYGFPVALSPTGEELAWHAGGGVLRVSDAGTGVQRFEQTAAPGPWPFRAIGFDAAGERLYTLAEAWRVWDAHTGAPLAEHEVARLDGQTAVAIGPDGEHVARCITDEPVSRDIDPRTQPAHLELLAAEGWELLVRTPLAGAITQLGFSGDGRRVVGGGCDGSVHVWSAGSGELEQRFELPGVEGQVLVAIDRDGGRVAATAFAPGDPRLWVFDLEHGASPRLLAGRPSPTRMAFHPDGERLLVGSFEGMVSVWHLERGHLVDLPGHTGVVTALLFGPDGDRLVSADQSGAHRLWHTEP